MFRIRPLNYSIQKIGPKLLVFERAFSKTLNNRFSKMLLCLEQLSVRIQHLVPLLFFLVTVLSENQKIIFAWWSMVITLAESLILFAQLLQTQQRGKLLVFEV